MIPEARQVIEAWKRGLLEWKLDSNQQGMYEFFQKNRERHRFHVWNASRQLGKSYLLCVIAIEHAIRNPGSQIKYAAPTAKMVRKILRPHFRLLFKDCPDDLKPRFNSQDGEYRFPNGSTITVFGCDRDTAENMRGQHADLVLVDEAAAISDLSYVVNDILMPMTLITKGRILIISTPAKSAGHPFKHYCDQAEEAGTYLERTVDDNPRLTQEERAEYCKIAGGAESTTWKREYRVEHVTDETTAVLPEATKNALKHCTLVLKDDDDVSYRPAFFDTLIWVDPGWNPDFCGIVWAIWCFEKAEVIIERDFIMRRLDTDALARELRKGTDELWGAGHQPYQCVSDVDHRLIADLHLRGWTFQAADKDNLDSAINTLRLSISGAQIPLRIHPRCLTTRRQFENATWNKARNKFTRTEQDGHFDVVSASIYGRRHLPVWHNPVPRRLRDQRVAGWEIPLPKDVPKTGRAFGKLFGFK